MKYGGACTGKNLAGRGHAHKKPAARRERLLGDEDRKRGSDNAAQDAIFMPTFMKDIEIGVVASPSGVADGQSSVAQISNHVAIGIENADFRNGRRREAFLAACFTQQVLGFEGGRGTVVLVRQDRRHFSH